MKSYRDLEVYQQAYELAIEVHHMTLTLPKYETYEQGSQLRRSSKSVKDNIVEGYGRKKYKADFVRFLIYAQSSCDEATSQIKMIDELHFESGGLKDLLEKYDKLGKQLNKFIQYVESSWK